MLLHETRKSSGFQWNYFCFVMVLRAEVFSLVLRFPKGQALEEHTPGICRCLFEDHDNALTLILENFPREVHILRHVAILLFWCISPL
jgi:hypothetical protein